MALSYGNGRREKPEPAKEKSGWVSMELDDETKLDSPTINGSGPDYPYGLMISLCPECVEKLKLGDVKSGEYIMFKARACVKNVNDHMDHGKALELQIEDMKMIGEDPE